jgi:NAD(P)-dependent dehydrogenase (short-subunit alcohol dehydrogenase family)
MPKTLMCDPALFERDLSGEVYIVTGANSGIGLITAEQLGKQGALVVLACRRVSEADARIDELRQLHRGIKLESAALDLGDLASVRAFVAKFQATHDRLDGLINNAGLMNTPKGTTKDGFETQFGVNHLGHFLLTELLLPTLKASAPSRVVCLSSCYHDKAMGREGQIDFDDLQFERRPYDGWTAYAQSKLANLLYAKELGERLRGTGVTAVSVHPGWVRTNLIQNSMPLFVQNVLLRPFMGWIGMIEPWEGAQTTLHATLADDVPEHTGAYYSQFGIYRDKASAPGGWPMSSPNPHAHDDAAARRLTEVSRALTGLA